MTKNLNLLFYLKKSRVNKNNEAPIYLRLTVDGKRAEISTGRRIDIRKWNSKANKGIGRSESIRALNAYLTLLSSKVYKIQKDLIEEEIDFDANTIKNLLSGKSKKSKSIIQAFQQPQLVVYQDSFHTIGRSIASLGGLTAMMVH